ncbi:alpha-E domain-containing protein [Dasania sp. GY-MA-18]|uniref:Alpha-E domain-containing protein n=1 Tax=Dasania phycosphaerae TaxID=2950436 RepID=A0A9J6RNG4_9GAMM|nr:MULTISPECIES: alpha-E domain-containing protein [Dasania]MCR8923424.1 alpha-E domain-containing protein [Dasania sp. GY-MA-18]MCZ0865857.1 alpha-E domain-containing protein [Dasania phycosphaerae]MCZ0869581.1 alpha-E domain-containing protein [Dasania phycosphaerae]
MLSRVVEMIYWTARYLERTENLARLINVNSNLLLDLPKSIAPGWEPLINITGTRESYLEQHDDFNERTVLAYLVNQNNSPSSLAKALSGARESARTIRDVIPRESWEQINALYLYAKDNSNKVFVKSQRFEYLNNIILRCQTLNGLFAGTMNQDEGYSFLLIGRNLERADMTTRIIDVRSADLLADENQSLQPFDLIQWMSVLKSLSAYQMYRRSMQVKINRSAVLKFLFQSEVFPRAPYHCIAKVEFSTMDLPNNEAPLRLIGRVKRDLIDTDVGNLEQEALHEYIDQLQLSFINIGDAFSEQYFLSGNMQHQQQADS